MQLTLHPAALILIMYYTIVNFDCIRYCMVLWISKIIIMVIYADDNFIYYYNIHTALKKCYTPVMRADLEIWYKMLWKHIILCLLEFDCASTYTHTYTCTHNFFTKMCFALYVFCLSCTCEANWGLSSRQKKRLRAIKVILMKITMILHVPRWVKVSISKYLLFT